MVMTNSMHPTNIAEHMRIAEGTGAFKSRELDILHEILVDCGKDADDEYLLVEERRDATLAGFSVFGELEWTDFTWEMYWIVVDTNFHGQGIGKKLLNQVEKFILKKYDHAILIAETSSIPAYRSARWFYRKTGFNEVGRIPHYYDDNDDLVTYYKLLDTIIVRQSFDRNRRSLKKRWKQQ